MQKTGKSTSTSDITKTDPPDREPPDGPYLRLIREARDNAPHPATATYTYKRYRKFLKRADAHGYILDVSYRQGTLKVYYIGQRKRELE